MIFIPTLSDDTFDRLRSLIAATESQQFLQYRKNLANISDALSRASFPDLDRLTKISQTFSETVRAIDASNALLSSKMAEIASVYDSFKWGTLYLDRLKELLPDNPDEYLKDISIPVDSAFEAIRASRDYLTEEQENTVNAISPEILTPAQAQTKSRRLTLSDVLSLIAVILSLIQIILQQLPDEQLDRLIGQNEMQIEQNATQIEQSSREIELLHQLADAQQQLLVYVEQSEDSLVELDDSLVEGDCAILKSDDFVDLPVEDPEAPPAEDDHQDNSQPDNA